MERLTDAIQRLAIPSPGPAEAERLLECLIAFRHKLATHFAREERSPMYGGPLAEEFPRFADLLDRLLAQHEEFLSELSTLTAEVRAGADAGPLIGRALELLTQIREHEALEAAILQHAYADDLGIPG